ncbi:hydrolase [Burkholderia pseudomultivorans]|uniref:Hydrolase n=1 Tax=Burkholderia pseudomultivorans TaxID=1207504 RepID=A0A6P2NTM6_9BURK|nr:lecithin retinol acyltransferase family protein [Burkholderia pseudomultivorans]VWB98223.1 hydrolase [Burkholderia pseudomultivorans]
MQTIYDLNIGDHVYVPRRGYNHHGLYIGDGTVARYAMRFDGDATGRVELVSLEQFCQGENVNVRAYSSRRFGRTMSVSRALMRLNDKFSNVVLNDCEHFVTWCIKGLHWNKRAENAIYEAASYELYRLSAPVLRAAQALELHAEEVISKATGMLVQRIATTMARFAAKALEHSALKGASQLINKGLAAVAKITGVTMTGPQFAVAVAAFTTWQLFDTVTNIKGGSSIPAYIKSVVGNVITKVVETAKGFLRRAIDAIRTLGTDAWNSARNAIGGFFNWAFDKLAFW